ncbi:MFS transporter [Streptomyces bullii]|uniref:MFS transporter n=1 Tax=Streptomyces bullii TaxID=349910 RepID=A0ABW0UN52_9ACTN
MTTQAPDARNATAARMFWRFWLASTVSRAGSNMTSVALPLVALIVLEATTFQVTLLAAASQAAWLFLGLPAGVIVQRYPLRDLQVAMDLVRMAAMGSVPIAWWLDALTYPHLLLVALITSLASVLFDVGNSTFLPALVSKEELTSRNSLISGTEAVTQTGGRSLSGLLVTLIGAVGVLLIDAVTYLVSAVILRTLPERRPETKSNVPALQLIREGWDFVVRHPVMRPCMIWATVINFVSAALVALTPLYLVREAGVSAAVVGVVIAMNGVGALIASAAAPKFAARVGTARAMIWSGLIGGIITLAIPFTTTLGTVFFFLLGNIGFQFGVVTGSIMARTHRQVESPPELLSRVMATVRFVSWGVLPLGAALSGVLAEVAGLRPALWFVCAGALIPPLILIMSPVRESRELSRAQEG